MRVLIPWFGHNGRGWATETSRGLEDAGARLRTEMRCPKRARLRGHAGAHGL